MVCVVNVLPKGGSPLGEKKISTRPVGFENGPKICRLSTGQTVETNKAMFLFEVAAKFHGHICSFLYPILLWFEVVVQCYKT